MKNKLLLGLSIPSILIVAAAALHQGQSQSPKLAQETNHARQPVELIDARAFVLDQPFVHNWRKERPSFSAGYLLVLRAEAQFLTPRQGMEPVLYVGEETAQRLNNPTDSGYLICLVPAAVDKNAKVQLDPTQTPIWFGGEELPERVDLTRAKLELAKAIKLGVVAPGPMATGAKGSKGQAAQPRAAATTYMQNRSELDLVIADLVEKYSPTEIDLIESLRLPLSR
jgi:hypothetical protein